MTYRILFAASILLFYSCKGEMKFKRVNSESSNKAPDYQDVYLVANTPNNKVLRDSLLVAFAKKTMPNFCRLDAEVKSYAIFFLKDTRCTRSFDERNLGDGWSLASDVEGCPEDKLRVFFWYKRSETNPHSWYLYLPKIPADTIYCEQRGWWKSSFHLWDYFGLDLPDLHKSFNLIRPARMLFTAWFTLQHLRGYKPFITKMQFQKQFKGNLSDGKAERVNNRGK